MIIIVDYGMGNLRSVSKALEQISHDDVKISRDPQDLQKANKIVLPGVGAFGDAMNNLRKFGLIKVLNEQVLQLKKPFLGICLGMQILTTEGFEHGHCLGLGWVLGTVKRFQLDKKKFKVPHVGWNEIEIKQESDLFKGLDNKLDFYFVHSFHMECNDQSWIAATCFYGYEFIAAIKKENIFATQFHPEKSQQNGLKILKNFVDWKQKSC